MTETLRPIYQIAADIKRKWGTKMYFGAVPYVDAMLTLSVRGDRYVCDTSDDILLRFFANASAFRGDEARALKFELAQHVSPAYQKDLLKKYGPK